MSRGLLFLAMALLLGGLAAWLVANWLDRAAHANAQTAAPPIAMTDILVARIDLKPGDDVTNDRVRWQSWPVSAVQPAYMVRGRTAPELYLGAMARGAIHEGVPIVASQLVRRGDHGIMAALIAPGRRAISIPVTATSGLAGFVGPGDRVDIILTANPRGEGRIISRTVARNVRVLAIGQRVDPIPAAGSETDVRLPTPGTVTLEVSPQQAEQLTAAQEAGRLSLTLLDLKAQQQPMADNITDTHALTAILGAADSPPVASGPLSSVSSALAAVRPTMAPARRTPPSSVVEVVRGGRAPASRQVPAS